MLRGRKLRRLFNLKAFVGLGVLMLGFFLLSGILMGASPVMAQEEGVDLGLNEASEIGLPSSDPRVIIVRVIQVALGFLGLIAVVLIMYGGYVMMTSEGNPERVEKAKQILKNAVIGLIIILSAFAIVSFLLNKLTGSFWGTDDPDDPGGPGIEALGNGIIKSVYPVPGQKDVAMNTSIIVTFREKVKANSICNDDSGDGVFCNCSGTPRVCDQIKNENIRIYKTATGDSCGTAKNNKPGIINSAQAATSGCSATNVTEVSCFSKDDETFVMQPKNYLGALSENIEYSVFLSEDIKKADDSPAFGGISNGFEWGFEVSNKIDLTPPQVKNSGVFPGPDDERDTIAQVAGIKATGTIQVLKIPQIKQSASAANPVKDPADAEWADVSLDGKYSCLYDGVISIVIGSDLKAEVTGVNGLVPGDSAEDKKVVLGCGLAISPAGSGTFAAGNKWKITVKAEKTADTLKVGSDNFAFSADSGGNKIKVGSNANQTASNIAQALSGRFDISASAAGAKINITAKEFGEAGNNIEISTNNETVLSVTPMNGGGDNTVSRVAKGREDKARNAVIQINFNEAINPISVSGNAQDVAQSIKIVNANPAPIIKDGACVLDADCASFKCVEKKCAGDNTYLEGKFLISNQYQTVEFLSNVECGVNACGEAIYCLPENSRLKVVLAAAPLASCNEEPCTNEYQCGADNTCKDAGGKNYPKSKIPLEGIADMALNSLDGNRNNFSDGPGAQSGKPAYDENLGLTGNTNSGTVNGDDFLWSFFINDIIDLDPPAITVTIPQHDSNGVKLTDRIEIDFSELMFSSTLTTGQKTIIDQLKKETVHKLLNLKSYTSDLVGYWVTSAELDNNPAGGDGEPDKTNAFINHSNFGEQAKYRAQAGSGIKDIYQNCYLPCKSGSCGATGASPSCCGNIVTDSNTCGSIFDQ